MFFLMPLNVVGEVAKGYIHFLPFVWQHHGRQHHYYCGYTPDLWLVIAAFLYGFFGLFVGTVQAFVFTMLTLVYISVQIR